MGVIANPSCRAHDVSIGIKFAGERFNGTRKASFILADTANVTTANPILRYATRTFTLGKRRADFNTGLFLGYDYHFSNGAIVGVILETDYSFLSENAQVNWSYFSMIAVGGAAPARSTTIGASQKLTWRVGLLGKVGFSFQKVSIYGLLGGNLSRFETSINIQDKYGANATNNSSYKMGATPFGVVIGLGLQYKFVPCFSVAFEGRWKKMKGKLYQQNNPSATTFNQAVAAFNGLGVGGNQLGTRQESILGTTPRYGLEGVLKFAYHF